MTLGQATFSLSTRALEAFQRQSSYSWVSMERINRRPAKQWTGEGEDSVTLTGVIFPHTEIGGRAPGTRQLEQLRSMAAQGQPYNLSDGNGNNYGLYCVESIQESVDRMFDNGAPRKQGYDLQLSRYGDDNLNERAVVGTGATSLGTTRGSLQNGGGSPSPLGPVSFDASTIR